MNSGYTEKRWPEFPGWDEKAEAIETLALACGAYVYCAQKYQYLSIEIQRRDSSRSQLIALHQIAEMIERLTDYE